MKLKQSQIALISLIVAILTLLVVAYTSLLPTIITGHENIECTNPNTGTIHLVGDLDSEIILDQDEYEEGSVDYIVSEVTFIIDTSTHSSDIEVALIDVSFGIILPGTSDPIYDPSWVFSFQDVLGGIRDYTFTNVFSDTISANSGDTIEVILVYDISGECTSIDPLDPLFPITRSPFPDTASFQADIIDAPVEDPMASLTGIVKNVNGIPLEDVSIALEPEGTDISDSVGFFRVRFVNPGTYEFVATLSGYETYRMDYTFAPSEDKNITVIMSKTTIDVGDGIDDGIDDGVIDGVVEDEIPLNVVIPIIAAIPVTIIILGIPFTIFPIRLVIVTIIDGIVAAYVIFFSGVV